MQIQTANTDQELQRCAPVMVQLRPHLSESQFVAQARRQSQRDGYIIAYVEDQGQIRAVAGFRVSECMASGRFLYVDDLVTDEAHRSSGFGEALFDWIVTHAKSQGCTAVSLDSGVQRHGAHRFYLRKRMRISSYHFLLDIEPDA
jgi:GNAT superfamily N-acetyltransferase